MHANIWHASNGKNDFLSFTIQNQFFTNQSFLILKNNLIHRYIHYQLSTKSKNGEGYRVSTHTVKQ